MLCPHIVPAVHVIGHACEQGVKLSHSRETRIRVHVLGKIFSFPPSLTTRASIRCTGLMADMWANVYLLAPHYLPRSIPVEWDGKGAHPCAHNSRCGRDPELELGSASDIVVRQDTLPHPHIAAQCAAQRHGRDATEDHAERKCLVRSSHHGRTKEDHRDECRNSTPEEGVHSALQQSAERHPLVAAHCYPQERRRQRDHAHERRALHLQFQRVVVLVVEALLRKVNAAVHRTHQPHQPQPHQ